MTKALLARNRHRTALATACLTLLLLAPLSAPAQESTAFDPIAAGAQLDEISQQLTADEVAVEFLARTRAEVVAIDTRATICRDDATADRQRLETRFEPLRDVDADVAPAVFDQRTAVRQLLDEAIDRQTRCVGLKDDAQALLARITATQTALSQQFLSNRGKSVIVLLRELPARMAGWPSEIRGSVALNLVEGASPAGLLWTLLFSGLLGAGAGVWLRHRFYRWYAAGGGDDMEPALRYLFPKPLADYSPLLLLGLALGTVLFGAIDDAPTDLAIVRIAIGVFIFGAGCVVIDWATGPLSPSARVKGLIPTHVNPLRLRLRVFVFATVASFVILGTEWLAISRVDPDVAGRSTMIFLVAASLIYVLGYLGRIPGVKGRYRLIRYASSLVLITGIFALLIGYQNLAGYLVHGVTRTLLALAVLWILLWVGSITFEYLATANSQAASRIRTGLGISRRASQTGLGFMQLVADLVVWLGLVVYLIYVWDESGTTLERLLELVVFGGTVGNIQLVPLNILIGILVFTVLLVVIGWMKRWIDKRWLQHIVIERGAREALITLFGYVGFIIAFLIGLTQAGVELGGLVWVSSALALGIGFGMQEIASNFVSGIILLFERPIRAGDFVTVGEVQGFVRSIRIRATEIESLDNQNVLVPNSELVSGHVTNWVLRDTYGRLLVNVGVAYGSDVEAVRDILEAVAHEHPEVITDGRAPAPRALFMGFGDSSLDFQLRVRIARIDRRFSVKSDINFAIDKAFREANIRIPFPQRDLHLVSYPEQQEAAAVEAPAEPEEIGRTGTFPAHENVTRSHREEIELPAGVEDVWKAITDVDILKEWMVTDGTFNAHIGGQFALSLRDGSDLSGRIDIFLPPRRMRVVVALREGEELPPSGPITAEFALYARDDKTRLSITVAGIPATEDWEEDYRRSEIRWRTGLAELQEYISSA